VTIGALLRTALELLEKAGSSGEDHEIALDGPDGGFPPNAELGLPALDNQTYLGLADSGTATDEVSSRYNDEGSRFSQSRREWLAAQRDNRCVVVNGDSMAPIVADGASVAYAKNGEDAPQLDGKLVVTWLENQPVVRWFQHCGRFALLRAQNPSTVPQQVLVDLEDPKQKPRFRRVLWVNTPH
jgi:hypothetical protein